MFLIVVDADSKWMEVLRTMKQATSEVTVEKLREMFAVHGLPHFMVSDNGPSLTGRTFTEFFARNGIRHVRVLPYHPASNGLAELSVTAFKSRLRKQTGGTLDAKIARFFR